MPVTFENSSTVTVRSPDGHWYEVRIVADDGHRPWPTWLFSGRAGGALAFGTLDGAYRLILRAGYAVRRSTRRSVEEVPWPDEIALPDRTRPRRRESHPDDTTARARAAELVEALRRGEPVCSREWLRPPLGAGDDGPPGCVAADVGSSRAPVGLAVDDEFVGVGVESVDG